MSDGRTAVGAGARAQSSAGRLIRAWRVMPHERRLAAYASVGLFLTMFLPWYQRQFFVVLGGKLQPAADSQTAWGAFSFVEAAVLLVAVGVLTLLFQRAEGKAFHLPGGDGLVVMVAGFWTCALIVWRIFDKQGGQANGQDATTYGIEWGIFIALAVAAVLAYAGSRIRAAHQPEPPLPGEDDRPGRRSSPPDPGSSPRSRVAGSSSRSQVAVRAGVDSEASRVRRPSGILDHPAGSIERPAPAKPEGPAESSDRRVGWLTARPSHAEQPEGEQPPQDWPTPEWPRSRRPRQGRPPKPVPADEAPTIRAVRKASAPPPPSTPAGQRQRQSDDLKPED
jgi:hypothetical protein